MPCRKCSGTALRMLNPHIPILLGRCPCAKRSHLSLHAPYAFLPAFPPRTAEHLAKSTLLQLMDSLLSIIARCYLEARDLLLSKSGDFLHVLRPGEHGSGILGVACDREGGTSNEKRPWFLVSQGSTKASLQHGITQSARDCFVRLRQIRMFVQGGRVFRNSHVNGL